MDEIDEKTLDYSSVQKTLKILLTFTPDNRELGVLELSRLLSLNKSTVSRLIRVLHYYDFVQQNEYTKKYSLGRAAASLGSTIDQYQMGQLAKISQPYIDNLRDTVKESVCVEVLSGRQVKIIAKAFGPPPLSVSFEDSLPFHVAAGGKSILAFSDTKTIENYSKMPLNRLTENTMTDFNALLERFEKIRKNGVSHDYGEANVDVHAIGAPIFNHRNKPVAAICICVPAIRGKVLLQFEIIQELKKIATQISEMLFSQVVSPG
jgi:DNA-binding IclR family transcriptional regulator